MKNKPMTAGEDQPKAHVRRAITMLAVRSYLAENDILECNQAVLAESLDMVPVTLCRHLELLGTTWAAEKLAERKRRLDSILVAGGKIDTQAATEKCGFLYSDCFFRFFTKTMGMNFTEYQTRSPSL